VRDTTSPRDIVIFDLGGVLIDWNPRYLYRKLFAGDDAAMEHFLDTVCTFAWHERHDAGELFAHTRVALKEEHPAHGAMIDAWGDRHPEMYGGAIVGTVDILDRLRVRQVPLYAITNFPAETFPIARTLFPFLGYFRDVAVSGEEKIIKPDPRLYRVLLDRNGIDPQRAVYIDDNAKNIEAANALGLHGIHFTSPALLEAELLKLGLLDRG
jgi:2-haloacid dehalogenase